MLKNGITKIAGDTALITNATSAIVFPPLRSPIIKVAISSAKTNSKIKDILAKINIIFFACLYAIFLALLLSSALYSLIILLMAFGSPALEIPKNIK